MVLSFLKKCIKWHFPIQFQLNICQFTNLRNKKSHGNNTMAMIHIHTLVAVTTSQGSICSLEAVSIHTCTCTEMNWYCRSWGSNWGPFNHRTSTEGYYQELYLLLELKNSNKNSPLLGVLSGAYLSQIRRPTRLLAYWKFKKWQSEVQTNVF